MGNDLAFTTSYALKQGMTGGGAKYYTRQGCHCRVHPTTVRFIMDGFCEPQCYIEYRDELAHRDTKLIAKYTETTTCYSVIPAKAGIQYSRALDGCTFVPKPQDLWDPGSPITPIF